MENKSYAIPRAFSDSTGYMDEKMAVYFGGDRTLSTDRVVELLVSTSFGANSILYAVWLGYLMGMWALVIHFAWCASFCLLAKFSRKVYEHTSIHDFLGCCFGKTAKKVAAVCSMIGLLYFAGWEIAIAKSGLEPFIPNESGNIQTILIGLVICIALLYTILGGQRVNGHINLIMNKVKISLLAIIIIGVFYALNTQGSLSISILVPDFMSAVKNLGVFGLVTNVLLNLSWQFVDNSSWQIISTGGENRGEGINRCLKTTAIKIFAIYFGETLLGASLRGVSGLDSDNILSGIVYIIGNYGGAIFAIGAVLLILISMMSLIDGMTLSVAQTIMVDLNLSKIIQSINKKRTSGISLSRVLTFVLGVLAAWGIQFMLSAVGCSIFDFVYVFTIVQLGLIGPIVIGLIFKPQNLYGMTISIVFSIAIGFMMSVYGNIYGISWFVDGAGATTVLISLLISIALYISYKKKKGLKMYSRSD